ncbi:acyl carrier protein phosphodiesterase [Abditibacteriota bacterium]|nr:acyl carrier protein phosphodiesterase [Abditibacteriota bacterium]
MNFLAHALLSGQDGDVLLGNLMADFLGPGVESPDNLLVQSGVERHYRIDHFMDSHPVVARSRARLFPFYRHYSAVLVDVFYDHLLAMNWELFCDRALTDFAAWVYAELDARREQMPPRMKSVVPAMMSDNWLVSYGKPEGVRYALSRVQHRSRHAPDADDAWATFDSEKPLYDAEFLEFFPLIMKMCE